MGIATSKREKLLERVKQLEKRLLLAQIKDLEDRITYLTKQTDPGTIQEVADKFIQRVSEDYERLLRGMCTSMEQAGICTYMDRSDFQQESYEYLLRYCLPKVMKYSTKTKMWLPYLKRSLNNSFENLRKKMSCKSRGKEIRGLEFHQENDLFVDDSHNPEDEYRFYELIWLVSSKLSDQDRKIFLDCLYPTPDYTEVRSSCKTHRQLRKALSTYYGVPERIVNNAFARIRKYILLYSAS